MDLLSLLKVCLWLLMLVVTLISFLSGLGLMTVPAYAMIMAVLVSSYGSSGSSFPTVGVVLSKVA